MHLFWLPLPCRKFVLWPCASPIISPNLCLRVTETQRQAGKHECETVRTSAAALVFLNQLVTLPAECFLRPVETDDAHPTMAPVCVWYMEAFVTLGGVLSVCLTVTLCECCWERVAIGASLLLSSAPPLPPLLLCLTSFLLIHFPSFTPFIAVLFLSFRPCLFSSSCKSPPSPAVVLHVCSTHHLSLIPPLVLPFLPSTHKQPH